MELPYSRYKHRHYHHKPQVLWQESLGANFYSRMLIVVMIYSVKRNQDLESKLPGISHPNHTLLAYSIQIFLFFHKNLLLLHFISWVSHTPLDFPFIWGFHQCIQHSCQTELLNCTSNLEFFCNLLLLIMIVLWENNSEIGAFIDSKHNLPDWFKKSTVTDPMWRHEIVNRCSCKVTNGCTYFQFDSNGTIWSKAFFWWKKLSKSTN